MSVYYNENDPKAAEWLRELIREKHIAPGEVDSRDIQEVLPNELLGYRQCHFFAGIGGWSYALRLAGWPDDRPVWTGSCPCQPFSAAGKRKGVDDERHLWPYWFWLIEQCRPAVIFGEQVANSDDWFDLVSSDLEGQGYAIGSAVLGAHSVGAPHVRQRRYFVADSCSSGSGRNPGAVLGAEGSTERRMRSESYQSESNGAAGEPAFWTNCDWIACRDGKARPVEPGTFPLAHGVSGRVGLLRGYGNAIVPQVAAEFIKAVIS